MIQLVLGIITHGGSKPNIIPEKASLEYSLRIPSQGELMVAKEKVLKCFHAAAMATGCQVSSFCSVQKYITASGPKRCKSGFVTH